jgi:hypothetical protein
MSTFPYHRVQILADAIYQNKLQSTSISRLRPTGAAHEGEGVEL